VGVVFRGHRVDPLLKENAGEGERENRAAEASEAGKDLKHQTELRQADGSDYGDSQANGIDESGNVVGWATYIPTGQAHAMLWTVVPEPRALTLLALGGVALLLRKRV
jgi:hypothetical protein